MSLYWPPFPFPATLPFGRSCLAIGWTSKVLQKTASQSKPRLCSASLSPCALKNVAMIGIRCPSVTPETLVNILALPVPAEILHERLWNHKVTAFWQPRALPPVVLNNASVKILSSAGCSMGWKSVAFYRSSAVSSPPGFVLMSCGSGCKVPDDWTIL